MLSENAVEQLVSSIKVIGLIQPITVCKLGNRYVLLAGAHRLAAYKRLGHREINAFLVERTEHDRRLIEIDENLCRAELTELEKSEHLAERKSMYETKHPETKKGAQGGRNGQRNETDNLSFSKATAGVIGESPRSVARSVRRAERIAPEVRDAIRGTPIADNGAELDALIELEAKQQQQIVNLVTDGQFATIREAKNHLIDGSNSGHLIVHSKASKSRTKHHVGGGKPVSSASQRQHPTFKETDLKFVKFASWGEGGLPDSLVLYNPKNCAYGHYKREAK